MPNLSPFQTRAVIDRLCTLLPKGRGRPPLNRVAAEAVLGRPPSRGERVRKSDNRQRCQLQRTLSRYFSAKPPDTMREETFAELVRLMGRYRRGWGDDLATARRRSVEKEELGGFETLRGWFGVTTDEEFNALITGDRTARSTSPRPSRVPAWVFSYLIGASGRGADGRRLLRDAIRAGIPDRLAMEIILRILSPFCGNARSGGRLLGWRELTKPALTRALRASIEAERIWLGLGVGSMRITTRPRTRPLSARVPNPLRDQPGLLAGMGG